MKKKLLTLLLLAPSLTLSLFEEDETHFINPSSHTYVLKNGDKIPLETIIDPNALIACLIHDNVEKFKMIEEMFKSQSVVVFNVRYTGFSLLQMAAWLCPESGQLFDYILSQVTKEQLNEIIPTSIQYCSGNCMQGLSGVRDRNYFASFESPCYYATAVAMAALSSPIFLRKILEHPLFDATSFLTSDLVFLKNPPAPFYHLFASDSYNGIRSMTPAKCLIVLHKCLQHELVHGDRKAFEREQSIIASLILILTDRFIKDRFIKP